MSVQDRPVEFTHCPAWVRKRPVVVEAFHFDGTKKCARAIVAWAGAAARYVAGELVITTLDGDHVACTGEYVICGTRGEYYPIQPAVYADVYEPAEAGE
jgi:hypothetical protein